MIATFVNTNTRIEVTRWYSIDGAPVLDSVGFQIPTPVLPTSAKFVFVDGDFYNVEVCGRPIKKDGSPGDRVIKVRDIYSWNQRDWPGWLTRLRDVAFTEFAESQK